MRTAAGNAAIAIRAEWRPPGDVPEPPPPLEVPEAPPERPAIEPNEVPELPSEPREKPPPEFEARCQRRRALEEVV